MPKVVTNLQVAFRVDSDESVWPHNAFVMDEAAGRQEYQAYCEQELSHRKLYWLEKPLARNATDTGLNGNFGPRKRPR